MSITPELAEAAQSWRHRYDGRPGLHQQGEDAHRQPGADWGEPYAGLDGMLYTPHLTHVQGHDFVAVHVWGRGAREVIDGFRTLDDAHDWVRDERCAIDSRPFAPPPGQLLPRLMQEERILSALLRRPEQLRNCLERLPATTFTTDLRYEIFAALYHIHHSPPDSIARAFGRPGIDQITWETLRRLAWSPDWDNPRLGGPGTPLASAYLHRLALTDVTAEETEQIAKTLTYRDRAPAPDEDRAHGYDVPPKVGAPARARRLASYPAAQPTPATLLAPSPTRQPQPGLTPRM
jgi:hypothetical protein